ncbi:hypothetical protein [Spirillospora sp. NPDC029432]|uniref:hypothetical protein n=1 Tax=Spirillospora sp. NPDC029432 TaxID=3154599 RepID=UPI0034518EB1
MYRQGDILILPVPETDVPQAVRDLPPAPRDGRGRMVLALGEATGHAHAIAAPGSLLKDGDPLTPDHLHLPSGGRLAHEEHAEITLPKGWFRVIRQREYVPGAVRVVAD